MSLREQLILLATIAVTLPNTGARAVAPEAAAKADPVSIASDLPDHLPLHSVDKLTELEKAYLDAYSILSQKNSCSDFFGGPAAIHALNDLTRRLRPAALDKEIS